MKKQYMVTVFLLCFLVWAVVIDNAVLPSLKSLKQDVGTYTRYRVKKWDKGGKLDLLKDELLVYAVVKNREQLYYMDYKPHFEQTLKSLAPGTPLQLRYANRFPKFWKRHLYDLRNSGIPVLGYSPGHMITKQKEIWKFTGIMAGAFLFLAVLGFVNKPSWKK
jgi:hypothetical protein